MSNLPNIPNRTPNWFWLSFIPVFGGLAFIYAGNKVKKNNLIWIGIGFTASALIFSSTKLAPIIWISQICTAAFYLREKVTLIAEDKSRGYVIPDRKTASIIAAKRGKIDINTCSKDELVYDLSMPIVYANNIESIRNEGYMFTHLEELNEIAGIPESYLRKIEPLITFGYHVNKEADVSWRRLNVYTEKELINCGLEPAIAKKIVEERDKNGFYKSVIDLKNRTGIPIRYYRSLI